jgi:hypothetical protein
LETFSVDGGLDKAETATIRLMRLMADAEDAEIELRSLLDSVRDLGTEPEPNRRRVVELVERYAAAWREIEGMFGVSDRQRGWSILADEVIARLGDSTKATRGQEG